MATKSMPNVKLNVQFTKATTLANIVSEENIVTSFGKLALWYDKLNTNLAFTNKIGVSIATPGTSDAGKFLKADGTWATPTNTNTTYTLSGTTYNTGNTAQIVTLTPSSGNATTATVAAMTGATAAVGSTAAAAGKAGLVPKPAAGDDGKFLMGNGTWHDCICPDDVVTVTCIA